MRGDLTRLVPFSEFLSNGSVMTGRGLSRGFRGGVGIEEFGLKMLYSRFTSIYFATYLAWNYNMCMI
jgi:hypothetical protein